MTEATLQLDDDSRTYHDKLDESKHLVEEAVQIMNNNIRVLYGREARLELLREEAQNLEDEAAEFKRINAEVKRKMWWKRFKLFILVGAILVFLIGVIILIVHLV